LGSLLGEKSIFLYVGNCRILAMRSSNAESGLDDSLREKSEESLGSQCSDKEGGTKCTREEVLCSDGKSEIDKTVKISTEQIGVHGGRIVD
jgi:hypothetical protein